MQELKDTQSEADTRNISIDRVGVKGLRFPIQIQDKLNRIQSTVATVSLAVDLPEEFKGTHMSRFVEALHQHGPLLDVHTALAIPRELLRRLSARRSHVEMEFPFFRSKNAPVTGIEGLMDYVVRFEMEAEANNKLADFKLTVIVPVTTLCPCSKAMSAYGAHNQRGLVTYSVRFASRPVWIEDLIDLVESCASCSLFSVLKRPDEKWVTEKAYENPVFVEDLVRNVALKTQSHSAFSWYRVEAENFESIHNHQAYAVIERDLRSCLSHPFSGFHRAGMAPAGFRSAVFICPSLDGVPLCSPDRGAMRQSVPDGNVSHPRRFRGALLPLLEHQSLLSDAGTCLPNVRAWHLYGSGYCRADGFFPADRPFRSGRAGHA